MAAYTGQIEKGIGAALTLQLTLTRQGDPYRRRGGVITGLRQRVEQGGFSCHGQVQVNAIEQGAGEFVAIALDLLRRATAAAARFAKVATSPQSTSIKWT